MSERLHILTGAPGTGKTTLVQRLAPRLPVVAEPARRVIADERRAGRSHADLGAAGFIEAMLAMAIDDYDLAVDGGDQAVLFDRGIPDCAAYALYMGTDLAVHLDASALRPYNRTAFVTPPWEAIYTTDEERTMTFEMTVRFHDAVVAAFAQAGYTLLEIPRTTIDERIEFVSAELGLTG